jgi:hypothetical protein
MSVADPPSIDLNALVVSRVLDDGSTDGKYCVVGTFGGDSEECIVRLVSRPAVDREALPGLLLPARVGGALKFVTQNNQFSSFLASYAAYPTLV